MESRRPQKILLVGAGGREHALAWKLARSERIGEIAFMGGANAGMGEIARPVPGAVDDVDRIREVCRAEAIDLVVVGGEAALVAGVADALREDGVAVFGPSRAAAALEASKAFAKDFMTRHGIPTARHRTCRSPAQALAALADMGAPVVVKADGLAAGKGVVVAGTEAEARAAIEACFSGAFGAAGATVVLEERLVGEEASYFALTDGRTIVPLATAQDHKRAFDGDAGPNTGGMGAYSPAPIVSPDIEATVLERIVRPTIDGMAAAGTPFTGVLYVGLMITADGPKVIEYNVRFGDPECQVLMVRLESDLLDLLQRTATGSLEGADVRWTPEPAVTVVIAARGYPGSYARGEAIGGLDAAAAEPGVVVFHAGTRRDGDRVLSNGGRVLGVTARGADLAEARASAYRAVDRIEWPGGFCRRDIGARATALSTETAAPGRTQP